MLLYPCADKNLSVLSYVEVFWWARVDCASLTHIQNKNLSVLSYVEVFWWSEAT